MLFVKRTSALDGGSSVVRTAPEKGKLESLWNEARSGNILIEEMNETLNAALSGNAGSDGWGIHIAFRNPREPYARDGSFVWLPSKREMLYFFRFLYLNPLMFGEESIWTADKKPETSIRSLAELQQLLETLSAVQTAGDREVRMADAIYGPKILWFGPFAELAFESTPHARRTRQQFRAAKSSRLLAAADEFEDSPVAICDLEEFRRCFGWGRVRIQCW